MSKKEDKRTARAHQAVDISLLERKLKSLRILLNDEIDSCLEAVKFLKEQQALLNNHEKNS